MTKSAQPTGAPGEHILTEWSRHLSANMDTNNLGCPILGYDQVASTNDVLKELALKGAPEGTTVVAHSQTKGRGRRGRGWVSPPGMAVYLSVLLKPTWPVAEMAWLGVFGGVATADLIQHLGMKDVLIKWPNDVQVRGRKIAGVLVEPRVEEQKLDFAVLGIGVNVRQTETEWPDELRATATSCLMEGADVDCDRVITQLLLKLDQWYLNMLNDKRDTLLKAWATWSGSPELPELA